jgi:hypothetical protein
MNVNAAAATHASSNDRDDETEDDEVKFNCIGGIRGSEDPDTDHFSNESDDDEEPEPER